MLFQDPEFVKRFDEAVKNGDVCKIKKALNLLSLLDHP